MKSKLEIEFETDNAAFDDNYELEVIRVLNKIQEDVACGCLGGTVRDLNGNKIGKWTA